ncbi:MAG: hypothetical protein AUG51_13340 [Acidobacteria bacterium 13_1_20CM_3_53_8]|nr:MAG: hypothetical protein AUG51_13340 [Acidobacteria bacterium 13_1_20CM_3_53_8]
MCTNQSRASGAVTLARRFNAGKERHRNCRVARATIESHLNLLSQPSLARRLQNLTFSPGVETPG